MVKLGIIPKKIIFQFFSSKSTINVFGIVGTFHTIKMFFGKVHENLYHVRKKFHCIYLINKI